MIDRPTNRSRQADRNIKSLFWGQIHPILFSFVMAADVSLKCKNNEHVQNLYLKKPSVPSSTFEGTGHFLKLF